MTMMDKVFPIDLTCPACRAEAGERCLHITSYHNNRYIKSYHHERRLAAKRLNRENADA